MAAPFAALEDRVNAAVIAHLANATADFGGGVVVDGEFSSAYRDALGQIISEQPTFRCLATVTANFEASVTIDGEQYLVVERHSESAGMVRYLLQRAG